MDDRELLIKSIQHDKLLQLFEETMGDKPQEEIKIGNIADLNFQALLEKLNDGEYLFTGFQIWDNDKKCVVNFKDETTIKGFEPSDLLRDESIFNWLLDQYRRIARADKIYTIA